MRITEFQIDRYGPLPRLQEACDGGITVVHGPNESGKTLLLESVLKLLDPSIEQAYPEIDRVGETPSGYVVVETADGEVKLGDGTTLPDIAPIEAAHLRNIFTVRDSDLSLHDQHAFYDSLTDQIGDLHTTEIEAIKDEFEERGRLTPGRRNLSNDRAYDNAKDVRDRTGALAADIEEYVEDAAAEELDDTERQLLGVKRQLRTCREELDVQEQAATVAEHARLADRLETFEAAVQTLEDRHPYAQEELERLTSLDHAIERATDEIGDASDEIASLSADIERAEDRLGQRRAERESLANRDDAVDDIEGRLDAHREDRSATTGSDGWLRTTRRLAIVGLALGAIVGIAGATLPAIILLLVGVGSAAAWGYRHRQVTTIERQRSALLEAARDAGFEVESIAEIAPAIQSFRSDVETVEQQITGLEHEIAVAEELIEGQESRIAEAETHRADAREDKQEILDRTGVEDIAAYRDALETTATVRTDRSTARQSLVDGFGEPDAADAGSDVLVEYWHDRLTAMIEELEVEAIDPDDADEAALTELRRRVDELERQEAALKAQLEEHRHAIRRFASAARDIPTDPFVDEPIVLQAETIDGLAQLQADLASLVERIERDADVSRVGLAIFDEIHDEEEEKITDLFDGESRAAEVFRTITQDRYEDVSYDPDAKELLVEDTNGATFAPADLSHGTREQLYFATRVSLSEQLLNEAGFFILDDAFLPADRRRLEEGFAVLEALADDGWQIIYLTAKHEVGVGVVEEHGLPCIELDPLP